MSLLNEVTVCCCVPLLATATICDCFLSCSMDGADLAFEIVKRASAGFVYSEAVAR